MDGLDNGSGAGSAPVDGSGSGAVANPVPGDNAGGVQPAEGVSRAEDFGTPVPGEPANTRMLREAYRAKETELKEWASLGDRQAIQSAYSTYTRQLESVQKLGSELGYSPEEIQTAFAADPVGTISYLAEARRGASQQVDQPQLSPELQAELDRRLAPLQQAEQQRQVAEASRRYDDAFDRMFKEHYPDGGPDEVRNMLYDMVSSRLSQNRTALSQIAAGKYEAVAAEIKAQKEMLLKAFAATGQTLTPKTVQATKVEAPPKNYSLDDIISNPALLGAQYQ